MRIIFRQILLSATMDVEGGGSERENGWDIVLLQRYRRTSVHYHVDASPPKKQLPPALEKTITTEDHLGEFVAQVSETFQLLFHFSNCLCR